MLPPNVIRRNNLSIEGNLYSEQTIVFANGFGTNQSAWRYVKASFYKDYKLVLFDHTGGGHSDSRFYDHHRYASLEGYAEDLVEIGAALNLTHAVFVGHSVSGMVGLLASLSKPSLFEKIILIGASPRYANQGFYKGGFEEDDLEALFSLMRTNYYEWVQGFAKVAMQNQHKPVLRAEFAKSLLSLRPDIALSVARTIFLSDYREILAQVEKEVLILQTEHDVAVPSEVAAYLHNRIKGSKLEIIHTEGHFPHMSAHEEVTSAIMRFLNPSLPVSQ